MASAARGVILSTDKGLIFLDSAGYIVWHHSEAMAPVAATEDSIYTASSRGLEKIEARTGKLLWRRESCAVDSFAWIIASRYGAIVGCNNRSDGSADLTSFSPLGEIKGKSIFVGGAVASPQIVWLNDKYAVVSGASFGGATVIRSALVGLTDGRVRTTFTDSQIAGTNRNELLLSSVAVRSATGAQGVAITRVNLDTGAPIGRKTYYPAEDSVESPFDATAAQEGHRIYVVFGTSLYFYSAMQGHNARVRLISALTAPPLFSNGLAFVEHRADKQTQSIIIDLQRGVITRAGPIDPIGSFRFFVKNGAIVLWQHKPVMNLLDIHAYTLMTIHKVCVPQHAVYASGFYFLVCSEGVTGKQMLLAIRPER